MRYICYGLIILLPFLISKEQNRSFKNREYFLPHYSRAIAYPKESESKNKEIENYLFSSGIEELEFVNNIPALQQIPSVQDWSFFGPQNPGGRVRDLAVDLDDSNILLTGGVSGGIFRSTDGANSWQRVISSEHIRLSSLAQDPRPGHRDTWYATTGELSTYASSYILGHGIYKSEDNGITWNRLESSYDSESTLNFSKAFNVAHRVVVHPKTGDVYVAALNSIHRSQNGGQSFETILGHETIDIPFITTQRNILGYSEIHITADTILYAALNTYPNLTEGGGGIYTSQTGNTGEWTNISPNFFQDNIFRIVITSSPSHPNQVYFVSVFRDRALFYSLYRDTYLYLYRKDKNEWTDLSVNLPAGKNRLESGPLTQRGYNIDIAVHPQDTNLIFIGMVRFYWSTNGFRDNNTHSLLYSARNVHGDTHSFTFDPNNSDILYITNDGGVNKTDQSMFPKLVDENINRPINYFTLNNVGLSVAQCYDIDVAGKAVYAGTQDQSAWLGTSQQSDWSQYPGGDVPKAIISKDGKYLVYNGSDGPSELIENIDSGFSTTISSQSFLKLPFLLDYYFNPANCYQFIGTQGDSLYIIDDIKAFLKNMSSSPPRVKRFSGNHARYVKDFRLSSYPPGIAYSYVGGHNNFSPFVFKISNVLSDEPTLVNLPTDGFPINTEVSDMFINVHNANHLMITFSLYHTNKKILFSEDGGMSWQNITGNLASQGESNTGPLVLSAAIMGNDSIFFAGTTSGLFSTINLDGDNTQWHRVAPHLIKNLLITDIEIDKNGRITVGTYGAGTYRAEYDINASLPVGFLTSLENLEIAEGTSKTINLHNHIIGENSRIEVTSTHPNIAGVSIQEENLRITAGSLEGTTVITVTLHSTNDGYGAVESFAVSVFDSTKIAQLDIAYSPSSTSESIQRGSLNLTEIGNFTITNHGNENVNLKSVSHNNHLYTTFYSDVMLEPQIPYSFTIYHLGTSLKKSFQLVFEIDKYPYYISFDNDDDNDDDQDDVPNSEDKCPGLDDSLIGRSCDDKNLNTINDVYTEQCVCQGVLLDDDKDGVPNSEDKCPGLDDNLIGSSCDDNDDDQDGVPNSEDKCTELDDNLIGASCDDNNANTVNDVYTEQCVCQGVLLDDDQDGVPNSEDKCPGLDDNLIGRSCDDNNANTVNDVYTEQCVCQGVLLDDDQDGVPNSEDKCLGLDDNLIGDSCDDNNANTINDVYTEQCVCQGVLLDDDKDGVPNSEDRCPELDDNLIGRSCDDNNANTANDVYTEQCVCQGVLLDDDKDGVPNSEDKCPGLDDNLIGSSCDDNNLNTVNDVYTEQCVCQGVLLDDDQDGVPNSEDKCRGLDDSLIGDSCDDNNANTVKDVYTEQCVCQGVLLDDDQDGVPNSEDKCPGLDDSLIGASCDDDNANTIKDVYTEQCVCQGVLLDDDQDGVPNSEDKCPGLDDNLIGRSCDDNNVNTINDVYTEQCVCQGVLLDDDKDGVPNSEDKCPGLDDNLIGRSCDDNNVNTINDVYTEQCVCQGVLLDDDKDGVPNSEDKCPGLDDNMIGRSCDDNNANTGTDVYTDQCVCQGVLLDDDQDGVPNSEDKCPGLDDNLIGRSCDDNNVNTINDVYTEQCVCQGVLLDDDKDGVPNSEDRCPGLDDNLIGRSCDDNNLNTINDVYTEQCVCQGVLLDDDKDGVPNSEDRCPGLDDNLIGRSCDDNNVNTVNDTYINCICEGQMFVLGTELSNVDSEIKVYPSPVLNVVHFKSIDFEQAVLYNLSGEKLNMTTENSMDISTLTPGIYLIIIHTKNFKMMRKIIKK